MSATALVIPLLAVGAADAAGTADLSITKTVMSASNPTVLRVPGDFDPTLSGTRSLGHYELSGTGLHVWTEAAPVPPVSPEPRKSAEYVVTDTPLSAVGSPSLEYTPTSGAAPGYQLRVDLDGNGTKDAIVVGEYGIWWGAELTDPALQAQAPHVPGPGNTVYQGSIADWQASFPNARVLAFGFSLGSNATGDGVIDAINFAGTRYTFGSGSFSSSVQAAPGETVRYRLLISNSSSAGLAAADVTVTDVLPSDLTYVPGSLIDRGNGCSVSGQTLTCHPGTFPVGFRSTIYFKAKLSSTVSSAGLSSTIGHIVDVQKQEVFADLPAGQTKTYSVLCPSGYVPTDGGLLVDAVDQGGYYSDLVVSTSGPTVQSGIKGWTVTASNLGDERAQGKVKVTCLDETIGSSNGHTHTISVTGSTTAGAISAASTDTDGEPVTATCPAGYTPIAPEHTVTSGIAVVRSSYASGSQWRWTVDHEEGTAATFDVDCLAPETDSTNGHTATLTLTTQQDTISVGPESRDEGIEQCGSNANAITGGYDGQDAAVLSLGKEQRGNNYMLRFYNQDWAQAWNAGIQVTCVAVRTADEPQYYHVRNTATVSSPSDPTNSSSTADVSIVGDPVLPAGGVLVGPGGDRIGPDGHVRNVNLRFTCTSACSFTVKVIKGGNVVAKATKSLAASPDPRWVYVPTTSAGRNLGAGQVSVKVKTATSTTTTTVTLS